MSNNQLSPGLTIQETSIYDYIDTASSDVGAFVGSFEWGPVNEVRTISGEKQLTNTFGFPREDNYVDFFSAANFLAYTNTLRMVRVVPTTARNAVSSGTAILIKNESQYLDEYAAGQAAIGAFASKYAGIKGNSLKWSYADSASYRKTLTGTIDSAANSAIVVGTGTQFQTELTVGSILKTAAGVVIGTVLSIASATSLTLKANATVVLDDTAAVGEWEYAYLFPAPSTSSYAAARGGSNDEMHIVVIDAAGSFSGTKGTILERFAFASKASDSKSFDGSSNYYVDVVNRQSQYLWWMDHPASVNWGNTAAGVAGTGTTFTSLLLATNTQLTGGVGGVPVDTDIIAGYSLFTNDEAYDISLIITGGHSLNIKQYAISNIAEVRKDTVVYVSPSLVSVINNVGQEATDILIDRAALPSSSYAFMDSGWKYQYDRYNDKYRWIPLNPDMAGLAATQDDYFISPGGVVKGQVKNCVRLAYSPQKTDRDDLYQQGVNPVITTPGQGTYLFGDKTLLSKNDAFDRINVRRLFIGLEKSIGKSAKYMLFEFNDSFTRSRFKNMTEPFLRTVQAKRGISKFRVICDETNNTSDIIDSHQFVGTIYVLPASSINFITLNFVATGASVNFETLS